MTTNQLFAIRIVEPSRVDERGFFHPEIVRVFFCDMQQKIRYAPVDGLICKAEIENTASQRPIVSIEGIGHSLTQQLPLGTRVYHFLPNGVHTLAAIINGPLPEKFYAQSFGRAARSSQQATGTVEELEIKPKIEKKLAELTKDGNTRCHQCINWHLYDEVSGHCSVLSTMTRANDGAECAAFRTL